MFNFLKKQKEYQKYVSELHAQMQELRARVDALEGWKAVKAHELNRRNLFRWVQEHSLKPMPTETTKKRGRPVGSKNKEK